jgi:hypothetical protein
MKPAHRPLPAGVRIAANTVADGLLADGLYAVSTLARL